MDTILRHEVIQKIDSGDPFNLVFITADRRRGTGGTIKRVANWVKIKGSDTEVNLPLEFAGKPKDPAHTSNRTFNICNPANPHEHPVKVHWLLMIFYNGKKIV